MIGYEIHTYKDGRWRIDSIFDDNDATGTDGNPGNGGCGGAIYMDGGDETATFCGVRITNNTAGAIGGGVFRVSNSDDGSMTIERSTVSDNRVTPDGDGNAGASTYRDCR